MTREHKYIKREGTPGNYKYIYEEDLKNTPQKKESKNPFAGVGKGVASWLDSAEKGIASTANAAGKGISSAANKAEKGLTVGANKARKDVKNFGNKLVMGANGAVEKVKDAAETGLDKTKAGVAKAREAVGDGIINAYGAVEPAVKAIDKTINKVKKTTLKAIDDNKTVTKSGSEFTRLYGNRGFDMESMGHIESVKGKKKDVAKFEKYYQADAARDRIDKLNTDAWRDEGRAKLDAEDAYNDYFTKDASIGTGNLEWRKPEDLKKKYPYLAKEDSPKYARMFEGDAFTTPKALRKEFDTMMDTAEAAAKAKDYRKRSDRHFVAASNIKKKAKEDYEKSGASKRLQFRATVK